MKKLILLFLCVSPLVAAAQDVPNGNFESWFWAGWSENPEFWVTDNTELFYTVTKDFDSYEGDIAMRVTAQPTGIGEYGEASTLFELDAVPAALNFYAKTYLEFGAVSVEITFLNNENEVYTETWFNSESMPEYTLISIPLDQIEPVLTHARITVSAQVGDLVAGDAWISVDAMAFGEPTGLYEREKLQFKIYPNPTSDIITIQAPEGLIGLITIVDINGKKVHEEFINREYGTIDIHRFPKGIYTIVSNKEIPVVAKFVVN